MSPGPVYGGGIGADSLGLGPGAAARARREEAAQNQLLAASGLAANGQPIRCPFSVSGVDGKFIVEITNPQGLTSLTPGQTKQQAARNLNAVGAKVLHQLQSSTTITFDESGAVRTYGPDAKTRWDIVDSPNETRFWRLRSSFDSGNTYNAWAYAEDPLVCGVVAVWSSLLRSTSQMPNAQLNTTNYATVDSIDNGVDATIRVYGAVGGVGTSWNRQVGAVLEGPFPSGSLVHYAYTTDYWVYYDATQTLFRVYTAAQFSESLNDLYRFAGKVTTVAGGGGGGSSGGGGGGGIDHGCVEIGTPVEFYPGSEVEEELIANSDWVDIDVPGELFPLRMHPDTLVSVFKRASELQPGDRIERQHGEWFEVGVPRNVRLASTKVRRRVKPHGVYLARGCRLHNIKPSTL